MCDIKSSIVIIFVFCYSVACAQENYSKNQLKELARISFQEGDFETSAQFYEAYLKQKPNDVKAHFYIAESYRLLGNYKRAADYYTKNEKVKEKYPLALYYQALMLKAQGDCESAIPLFEQFRKEYLGQKEDRKYRRLAKFNVEGCKVLKDSALALYVQPYSEIVNSEWVEGAPIFLDEHKLAFNRLEKGASQLVSNSKKMPKRKFYIYQEGEKQIKDWDEMNFNPKHEIVNGSFNAEKNRFYYTHCETNYSNKLNCDLYVKEKRGEVWQKEKRLNEEINTNFIETQPAVGTDEKGRETIYFVSDREGGKGGKDIWYSTYYENKGTYRTPRNCGSKINSVGDEITPFINPLNGKLLFSSNGHPGFGLFDVFESNGQRSKWLEPKNIGAHINSPQDEVYYIVNEDGKSGLFASNRPHKKKKAIQACCDDLFVFNQLSETTIKVVPKVLSEDSSLPIQDGYLLVYTKDSIGDLYFNKRLPLKKKELAEFYLEGGEDYVVKAYSKNHLSETKAINLKKQSTFEELNLNFKLKPMSEKAYQLENVYYSFGKFDLDKEAFRIIDTTIYKVLIENPGIVVEIGSHTDDKGTEAYNNHLSQKRAESVVKYLRQKGIDKKRLTAKGYGESKPLEPNTFEDGTDNPEGRARNRRTEFRVIGKIKLIEED